MTRWERCLFFLSLFVFSCALSALCEGWRLHTEGDKVYESLQKTANIPYVSVKMQTITEETDPIVQSLRQTDFPALLAENPDTVAWIYIPDTEISFPVVQGEDNAFYLYHTFLRLWNNAVGSIFLDYRNTAQLEDFHSIVYGHRLNRGGMFSQLNRYIQEPDFYKKHPHIYLALPGGRVLRYEIFAFYEADIRGVTYKTSFSSKISRENYIAACLGYALYDTGVRPRASDKLLTLSTCTGHGHSHRCVVQARLQKVF